MTVTVTLQFATYEEAAEFMLERGYTPKKDATPAVLPTATITSRVNKSPGVSPLTRIGAKKKESVLAAVGMDVYAARYIGKDLPYLQLLWGRGELKFDGEVFYR